MNENMTPSPTAVYVDTRALADLMLRAVCVSSGDNRQETDERVKRLWADLNGIHEFFKEKKVSKVEFAVKYGACLRLMAKELLRAAGCPKNAIEVNLRAILESTNKSHVEFEVTVNEDKHEEGTPS